MRRVAVRCLVAGVAALAVVQWAQAACVFSEIMYNPPQGEEYEYVELMRTGDTGNIAGWCLSSGVSFTFPAGSEVPAGGRVIVCRDPDAFFRAYPDADPAAVFGPWDGALNNAGDTLLLANAAGARVEIVRYDDDAPWDFLADGFGPSLERVCLTDAASRHDNWRAGPVPATEEAFGGTPLAPGPFDECPPTPPQRPPIRISEIMYHPVLEQNYEDVHEFVEIANAGAEPIDLGDWRLVGGLDYVFPPVTIQPDQRLVVAFDRIALLEDTGYDVDPGLVLGDYGAPAADGNVRSLDNGGEKIGLVTAEGIGVDSLSYDDDFPWPVGADGLGAGRSWLPHDWLPLENHQYRGRSLERVSLTWPSNSLANWLASPLDGATPGRASSGARDVPLPVVQDIEATPAVAHPPDELLRKDDEVKLTVAFTRLTDDVPGAPLHISDVVVEYFIEDVARTDERKETIEARDDGIGSDAFAGDFVFTAVFPARPDRTIVRYRILADRGEGQEVVSPRPTDPYQWHAYYVSPVIPTETRVYEIFISPQNWGRMYTNASGGRVSGCNVRASWNAKVPAIFVHKGTVYDVWARYQGSRWNRTNGPTVGAWPYPRPAGGSFKALSWHINFPRYDQMEGLRIVLLNKLTQGCPGLTSGAGYRFFEAVGIPACRQRYIRFYVNGGYIRYMQELERIGETMIRRWIREQRALYPDMPQEEVGHLFKSQGCNCDEGPYGWGDARRLPAYCSNPRWEPIERYEYTYDPKTHEWAGGRLLMDLIEDLHVARSGGRTALREYFEKNFDLQLLNDYIAIINWAVPFDDMFQNHFFYRRTSDEKWFMVPWDLDRDFGEFRAERNRGPDSTLYFGEAGDPDNRSGWWNYVKDSYLKTYRSEYDERLLELSQTVLTPENMDLFLNRVLAEANPAEANQAATRLSCNVTSDANVMRNFARRRQQVVFDRIPPVLADAGEDRRVFAGDEVLFDASGSRPDPGPEVTYVWSNGMTGEQPTFVFDAPGVYEITLTVTAGQERATDSVTMTVLPMPDRAFREENGLLVMEAESYHESVPHGEETCSWVGETERPDYSGQAYLHAAGAERCTFFSRHTEQSPELIFYARFTTPGSYRVWVRALVESNQQDSLWVGLDGNGDAPHQYYQARDGEWQWSGLGRLGAITPQVVTVPPGAGLHSLSIWMRESGIRVDKILMTNDLAFEPTGLGPSESQEDVLAGEGSFTRGDTNGDRKLTVSDAVTILRHLFTQPRIECEDHADANDDGALNVSDAAYILQYLFLSGPPPPPPFPRRGYDETDDPNGCGDAP